MPSRLEEQLKEFTVHDRDNGSYALLESEIRRLYFKFYSESYKTQPGGLDRKTKELIAIGVSLATGCKNCLEGHIKKAIEYGATRQQLAETLAVTIGVSGASIVDRSDIAAANINLNALFKSQDEADRTSAENE